MVKVDVKGGKKVFYHQARPDAATGFPGLGTLIGGRGRQSTLSLANAGRAL